MEWQIAAEYLCNLRFIYRWYSHLDFLLQTIVWKHLQLEGNLITILVDAQVLLLSNLQNLYFARGAAVLAVVNHVFTDPGEIDVAIAIRTLHVLGGIP